MEFLRRKKKDIAEKCIAVLIILEIILLLTPLFFAPVKGTYYGTDYTMRLTRDTYECNGRKGFFKFEKSVPQWFSDEYGVAAIALDSGDVFGVKSSFVLCNCETGDTFISGRAIFYQILIIAAFFLCVYIAFIQKDEPIKRKSKNDDDGTQTC